ncbi:hypothetical protein EVAR_55860_1 [Eumeta japonica]|uniref:Uncharacterized protein n=1 Tax=Eumeta variegata TaxID=151549 RepID=A0A4C1Z578_EUMVA|nr:hypothetical protein EVAR_55860_1 [Eumeta japonica]
MPVSSKSQYQYFCVLIIRSPQFMLKAIVLEFSFAVSPRADRGGHRSHDPPGPGDVSCTNSQPGAKESSRFCITRDEGKQACDPSERRWSPPPVTLAIREELPMRCLSHG